MNTMNEAVEAVAIALCESALGGKRCPCKEAGKFNCADEFPGRQAQAALAAARPFHMEEAAGMAEKAVVMCSLGVPGEGPFSRQDRTVDETREQIVEAIRAAKTDGAAHDR